MPTPDNFFAAIDPTNEDWWAKWLFIVSTVLSAGVSVVAIIHGDWLTGVLGIAAALSGAGGTIAAVHATQKRDSREAFLTNGDG